MLNISVLLLGFAMGLLLSKVRDRYRVYLSGIYRRTYWTDWVVAGLLAICSLLAVVAGI